MIFSSKNEEVKINISDSLDDFIDVISENKEITILPSENLLKIIKDYKTNNVEKDSAEELKELFDVSDFDFDLD